MSNLSLSPSSDQYCWVINRYKRPYLTYNIKVVSSRLNIPKLSEYQISLYQKICDLRFDDNLTWKQVADSLNGLGYTSTRGGQNTSSTVCSTYFTIRKHFERQNIYHPLDLDDIELLEDTLIETDLSLSIVDEILLELIMQLFKILNTFFKIKKIL